MRDLGRNDSRSSADRTGPAWWNWLRCGGAIALLVFGTACPSAAVARMMNAPNAPLQEQQEELQHESTICLHAAAKRRAGRQTPYSFQREPMHAPAVSTSRIGREGPSVPTGHRLANSLCAPLRC